MPHFFNDLRGQVLRSSADRGGCLFSGEDLRETEISQFNVTNFVDDEVFWFQAS